jgi:hypothetical protein
MSANRCKSENGVTQYSSLTDKDAKSFSQMNNLIEQKLQKTGPTLEK